MSDLYKKSELQYLAEHDIPSSKINLWPSISAQLASQKKQQRIDKTMKTFLGIFRTLSWAGGAVVLILIIGWAVNKGRIPAQLSGDITASPGLTDSVVLEPTTDPVSPSPTPDQPALPVIFEGNRFTSNLFRGLNLTLAVSWPSSPESASIYQQLPPEPLTIQSARAMAQHLGVDGEVYLGTGEGDQVVYIVSDGRSKVVFNGSPWSFFYMSELGFNFALAEDRLPFEHQVQVAEAFLNARGLLDFPYTVEPLDDNTGTLQFIASLNGLPVRYHDFLAPEMKVYVDSQGEVAYLSYNQGGVESAGTYPIITAQEAWLKVINGDKKGISASWRVEKPNTFQARPRPWSLNQPLDLYGYIHMLESAESGKPPLMLFENMLVQGEIPPFQAEEQFSPFLHVWGQIIPDESGREVLHLDGWEISALPDGQFSGTIERRAEGDFLTGTDLGDLLMPDLPAPVPDGESIAVRGVVPSGTQTLEWSMIHAGDTGGWVNPVLNSFAGVNPAGQAGPQPTATPLPVPGASGTVMNDIQGIISAGNNQGEVRLGLAHLDGSGYEWYYLAKPYPEVMNQLYKLPVSLSGTLGEPVDGFPSIIVEDYRELYPGLRYEAWLGTYESTTLENEDVLLFTAQNGETYVIFEPLPMDGPIDSLAGLPGEPVIIEGLAVPGKSFAGYPVIHSSVSSVAEERTNLDGYVITSGQSVPFSDNGLVLLPGGNAILESIELVNIAQDIQFGYPVDVPGPYIQPVWRFTGSYENGDQFEILVQALREEYLE